MKDLVIIGAGGFGREVAWLVEEINKFNKVWNILGFIDENIELHGKEMNGHKVLGNLDYMLNLDNVRYVCAIGNVKVRKSIIEKCEKKDFKAATLIHPNVINSQFNNVGEGTIICANSVLTVNVNIGKHVIINLDCTVGHDAILEDYVTIYPSVNISGNCLISECVEIGTGTQIIQGKSIGKESVIGAGSVIVKDIDSSVTAVGVPAKVIKYHT